MKKRQQSKRQIAHHITHAVYFNIILLIINKLVTNEIVATIIFLASYRILIFTLQHSPERIRKYLFSNFSEQNLCSIDKEQLFKLLSLFHVIFKFSQNSYNSVFVKHELLGISASFTLLFGFFLVFRAVQFPILFFATSLIISIACCLTTYGLDIQESEPTE